MFNGLVFRHKSSTSHSTKVPCKGGQYHGERLSSARAQRRALMMAFQLAQEAETSYAAHDNTTVRQLCETMLSGKLGRVSANTYDNARTDYAQFLRWLGKRADEPARHITRADMKAWVTARRAEVRNEKIVHEAFTLNEVRLLIEKLPDEWSSAVRCCIGTYGQRLGDILNLRWEQFDWHTRTVHIITGKT